ncbi:hypothetical protein [Streptomyces griseomycini]|uniref:Uncharacterized protein n=1 Tax=Streptomyces griseomycini TaxID=66895 RepID=A0A7W7LUG1_9ACTN|nr:hypothetical protein [Streptomyces griseomycini]MBB4896547.1 hypothetical protein [Streptomyces griseomycini]GGR01627.1 hypothetical protein GCM10015536_02880 [Streptomyces griseomycini]
MSDATRRPGDDPLLPDDTRTAPDARTAPGAGTAPDARTAPGAGTAPDARTAPGAGTAPGTGTGLGAGTTPGAGTAPGVGTASGAGTAPGAGTGLGAGTTPGTGTAPGGDPAHHGPGHDGEGTEGARPRLLPHDDGDRISARLRHAVAGFVDAPRDAVEEADRVLQELTARVTDAVTERRRTLRRSWQAADAEDGGSAAATDTEQLRLALRDYRALAERLLRV